MAKKSSRRDEALVSVATAPIPEGSHGPSGGSIRLRGVAVNNLKNVSVEFPLGKLIGVTGVSGSGKSSLVFDTLFAESQRRFLEMLTPAAQSLLDRVERPELERAENLQPAVAIRQRSTVGPIDAQSNVATAADIDVPLGLLFCRCGRLVCPHCNRVVTASSPRQLLAECQQLPDGSRAMLGFFAASDWTPVLAKGRRSADPGPAPSTLVSRLVAAGFIRAVQHDASIDLANPGKAQLDGTGLERLVVIADRFVAGKISPDRLAEATETVFREGDGTGVLLSESQVSIDGTTRTIDGKPWQQVLFRRKLVCPQCEAAFQPIDRRWFDPQQVAQNASSLHAARLGGHAFLQLVEMNAVALLQWLDAWQQALPAVDLAASKSLVESLRQKLDFLVRCGLDYLPLCRQMHTVSTGESRRIDLVRALGGDFVDTLLVIDEPSQGLHPLDRQRLWPQLRNLCREGNTVVVVDHDPQLLTNVDHLIDIGPGAGEAGGRVVYEGPPSGLAGAADSLTAKWFLGSNGLSGSRNPSPPGTRDRGAPQGAKPARSTIRLTRAACETPVRGVLPPTDFEFPLGALSVVTGVSGSGKTCLVMRTLYPAVAHRLGLAETLQDAIAADVQWPTNAIEDVVVITADPLGRATRSNAATVLQIFDEIREVFAQTEEARLRQLTPGSFSLNLSSGGRCPNCRGEGELNVRLELLPDARIVCPECHGKRFQHSVLQVKYRDRSIADVLAMTAREATIHFRTQPKIQRKLVLLNEVGLGYLTLGQPTSRLSGGESQRLKLASRLATASRARTLILCDEPTTGLHPDDVPRLLSAFKQLAAVGHTVVLIDHDPQVLDAAETVLDLGTAPGQQYGMPIDRQQQA